MMPSCDHTGIPHFHSSTTSGSALQMISRTFASVLPRQSPSSSIRSSISADADPVVPADFFMTPPLESNSSSLRRSAIPTGDGGRLPDPLRHLRLVEIVLVDVDPARVLLPAPGRNRQERGPPEEGHFHVPGI